MDSRSARIVPRIPSSRRRDGAGRATGSGLLAGRRGGACCCCGWWACGADGPSAEGPCGPLELPGRLLPVEGTDAGAGAGAGGFGRTLKVEVGLGGRLFGRDVPVGTGAADWSGAPLPPPPGNETNECNGELERAGCRFDGEMKAPGGRWGEVDDRRLASEGTGRPRGGRFGLAPALACRW